MPKTRAETLQTCLERMPTPIGVMLVVTDEEGVVRALDWAEFEERMHRLLRLHYGKGKVTVTERRAPAPVRQALTAYYDGVLDALDALEVVTGGTLFQRNVWAALRTIPIGSTMSYGALATRIGRPGSARAVGRASGANPVGVIVPCHRVIGANAQLTGYAGSVERKHWLLAHEGAT